MSPADHVPRTPDRRSSSAALFGAFRSLTGGRLKSPTPPPSASSTVYTPQRSSSLAETLASPTASADGSLSRISEHVVLRHARPVLGGPPELHDLVEQLDRHRPFAERAAAVDKICKIMEDYVIENVLELWSRASDMLLPEQPDHVADSGYRLLRHCVGLSKLNALERNVLFDAASLRKNDGSFDKRLDIIAALTKGGRQVEACESSLAHFILASFDACYRQSVEAHKASRKTSAGKKSVEPTHELENLQQLFNYTIDICKFNSKVFGDDDLEHLLAKIVTICQETFRLPDIENSVKLFDTIITYVHVPTSSLRPCLEVLCAVHLQLENLRSQTWNTLSNLFKSHVGQIAINALLRTLNDGPVRKGRDSSAYRGTIQVLQQLLLENGRNGLPIVPMSLLFPALKASIQNPHKTQEEYVMDLVDAILSDLSLKELLLSEVDWTELLDIIFTCAERGDERSRAQSHKNLEEETISRNGSISRNPLSNGAGSVVSNGDEAGDVISNLDLSVPAPRMETVSRHSEDRVFRVLSRLDLLTGDLDFVQRDAVMELFMRLAHRLSDSTTENVIQYHVDERYLHPSNEKWLEVCRSMVSGIIQDSSRPRSLRIMAIKALRETYSTVEVLCPSDLALQCGALLLSNIDHEEDVAVLAELVDFAVDVADRASYDNFPDTIDLLKRRMQRTAASHNTSDNIANALSASFLLESDRALGSPCNVIATGFVRLFIRSVKQSARKTRLLYETLRHVAGTDGYESDARLTVLRLLFRLRADSAHALFVNSSSEGRSLAAILCRTQESAAATTHESTADQLRHEDQSLLREQRKISGSPLPSINKPIARHASAAGRVSKPVPPLWMYPGPKGLPEEPSPDVSRVVFSHINPEFYPLEEDILDMEITLWLELAISLLQKSPDWEVYSYVVVHLGPQLSNQSLVRSCIPQLKMLRNVICEQIRNSSFQEPPSHTLLKKADVAVCLFHILTVLISYHDYFEKSEEDDLVKAFIHGIGNWDRTSKWCIHALSVCCLELPLSVSKSLDTVVQKISQIVTKPATAIHILDFLTSLARMPELYKNFREDEFKMVFGVSFRYLQHIRDQRERAASTAMHSNHRSVRHGGNSREMTSSPDAVAKSPKPQEDDLPHYLYSLAYHVIAFWFMSLKMEDRPKLMPWIARSLRFTDGMGRQTELEEQGQVIVDMMNLVCYSDRDETVADENFAKPGDGEVWKKSWIVGQSLVTIETAARTGVSQIITRRPVRILFMVARTQTNNLAVRHPLSFCAPSSGSTSSPPSSLDYWSRSRSIPELIIYWYSPRRHLPDFLCLVQFKHRPAHCLAG